MIIGINRSIRLSADFADCLICTSSLAACMLASIAAFGTYAIFPLVGFFLNNYRITAVIVTGMFCIRLCPYNFSSMIIGINRSIRLSADFADRLICTSSLVACTGFFFCCITNAAFSGVCTVSIAFPISPRAGFKDSSQISHF